jgi:hypothetical protein
MIKITKSKATIQITERDRVIAKVAGASIPTGTATREQLQAVLSLINNAGLRAKLSLACGPMGFAQYEVVS